MLIEFKTDLSSLGLCLPPFLELADADRWKKRTVQLGQDAMSSPFQAKIVADYHWLELALSEQMIVREAYGNLVPEHLTIDSISALYFAQTFVGVHSRLSPHGRNVFEGRIRDALKSDAGFAPLYLEMGVARRLFDAGYEVELSDTEGVAQFDFRFWKGNAHGEVECKSLSCDAGRKIHRKDFYRFVDALGELTVARVASGVKEIVLITLNDRLPAEERRQNALREAANRLLSENALRRIEGDFFVITREEYVPRLEQASFSGQHEFYKVCRELYGDNCHVAGLMTLDGVCLVIVCSQSEDDHSDPMLEAMKKATKQFSGKRLAFIAMRFDDMEPADLLLRHMRRRIGILSYYLFQRVDASHVAATCFSAYRGLVVSDIGIGEPAFDIPNPNPAYPVVAEDYSPFVGHIPDVEFARILGEPLPAESISYIPFDDDNSEDGTGG
jgi:hypothetical protein